MVGVFGRVDAGGRAMVRLRLRSCDFDERGLLSGLA